MNSVATPTAYVAVRLDRLGMVTMDYMPKDLNLEVTCLWFESMSTCLLIPYAVRRRSLSPLMNNLGLFYSPNL